MLRNSIELKYDARGVERIERSAYTTQGKSGMEGQRIPAGRVQRQVKKRLALLQVRSECDPKTIDG
jgi:hypothetical protein